MQVMQYDPDEILREIDSRADWIEYKTLSRANASTTFEAYQRMTDQQKQTAKDCADAVRRCLEKINQKRA